MSGVTRHTSKSTTIDSHDLGSDHLECALNTVFVSPAELVIEDYDIGAMNIQTGTIHFTADAIQLVLPLDKIIKRTPFVNSKTTLTKVTFYFTTGRELSFIRHVRIAHMQMNPEMPATIENLTIDKDFGETNWYYADESPLAFDLDIDIGNKAMYCIIIRVGSSEAAVDLYLHALKIEYKIGVST